MEFLSKAMCYVMFGITCLMTLFLFSNAIYTIMDAYGKKGEAIMMAIGSIMLSVTMYFVYQLIKNNSQFLYASGLLFGAWIITLIVIVGGILIFVPLHWQ